ncbi:MAG: hypothetical protein HYS12_07665 [Planctomycetes bacterium]|nr:hypothetical protein [Planctomycetota bacterium]
MRIMADYGNCLRAASAAGVLLLHQTCMARSQSRDRDPLTAFADILLDMHIPPGDRFTRRRHFHGVGRYPGTLEHVAAELNPEGTDYLLRADDPPEAALPPALETLRHLLSQCPAPLTRQEILARWPEGEGPARRRSRHRRSPPVRRPGAGRVDAAVDVQLRTWERILLPACARPGYDAESLPHTHARRGPA